MKKGTHILDDKSIKKIERQFERKHQLQRMRRKLEKSIEEAQKNILEQRKKLALVTTEEKKITPHNVSLVYNVSAQTIYRIKNNWMRRNWK